MTIDPQSIKLAKDFEPVLLFHPDEVFFPIDPKFYLERCALWRNKPPSDKKSDWGEAPSGFPRKPQLAKGAIAALQSEATAGKTWIGATDAIISAEAAGRLTDDRFLQLAGWEPFVGAPDEVTAASNNRHPTLGPNVYANALSGGRHWYYCEHLSHQQLLEQLSQPMPSGLDLFRAVIDNPRFSTPSALIYHFFYAFHDEALRGCELAGEGRTFATFAGEWSAVAILIDSANQPLFIGLTSRNVGDPAISSFAESRIGMTVHKWSEVDPVGTHPKIFVSLGTHGNYLKPGPHAAQPFTPGDIDLNQGTCAQIETLDDVIPGGEAHSTPSEMAPAAIIIVKSILAALVLPLYFWIESEISDDHFGANYPAIDPNRMPQDETGGPLFGLVLRPAGLFVPEQAGAPRTEDWLTKTPEPTDRPRYDFIVDRETQLWWPPRGGMRGYAGRWGPRVTNDPKNRRCGMHCPDFALQFLQAVARL
jgi:hypothetical protein